MFILRQVWGKWVSGKTILGRHLEARDRASAIFSPILQMKKKTDGSHLLRGIWLVSDRVRLEPKTCGWHSPCY